MFMLKDVSKHAVFEFLLQSDIFSIVTDGGKFEPVLLQLLCQ